MPAYPSTRSSESANRAVVATSAISMERSGNRKYAPATAAQNSHSAGCQRHGRAERAATGERARAAVLARYTTRAMQDATLAVYRELS